MSKIIVLALILAQIITLATAASSIACKDHPLLSKVQTSVSNLLSSDASGKGKTKSDALFKTFTNAKPSSKTATDLGSCAAYARQNTCCDKNIVKLIDQVALLKAKPITTKSSVFQKFTNIYVAQANLQCGKKVTNGPLTSDDILKNPALTNFQAQKTAQATCKVNFAKAFTSFTRGALCTVCSGIDKVADYLNPQGQLKVSQDSVNQFVTATDIAATCFSNIFDQANLYKILDELNKAYLPSGNECITAVNTKMNAVFTKSIIQNTDGKGGKLCKGTIVFGDNSACESLINAGATLEADNSKRLLRSEDDELFRLLQSTPDAVVGPQGVSVYTTSSTDNSINETGSNINPSFDQISTTSSHIIKAAFALISLLVFVF
ncbi:hypothetical protein ABPG72_002471 [Tetrahymena utriculariae]